jgi:4-hydroxy-4-methyl-2-oxoglutarate aldolase
VTTRESGIDERPREHPTADYYPTTAEIAQGSPHASTVIPTIGRLFSPSYICAPAATCACAPRDNLALHAALITAHPGYVIVCDCDGRTDGGYFGELAALDARNRGLVGLVIDGSVRDAGDLEVLVFPVFCLGTAPTSCRKEEYRSVGEPVRMQGVIVRPGDQIIADNDAIVVVPAEHWSEVRANAFEVRQREEVMRARLAAGEPLAAMVSLPPEVRERAAPPID